MKKLNLAGPLSVLDFFLFINFINLWLILFSARKRGLGKVMCLHLSVIHYAYRGGLLGGCHEGGSTKRGVPWKGVQWKGCVNNRAVSILEQIFTVPINILINAPIYKTTLIAPLPLLFDISQHRNGRVCRAVISEIYLHSDSHCTLNKNTESTSREKREENETRSQATLHSGLIHTEWHRIR